MVNNRFHFFDVRIYLNYMSYFIKEPRFFLKVCIFLFSSAYLLVLVASIFNACLLVSAQQGKTLWQYCNRVIFYYVSYCLSSSDLVKVCGPFIISDSWCSIGDHFDRLEYGLVINVNVGNYRKPTSHTDSSDPKSVYVHLFLYVFESFSDIGFDFLPHVIVSLLNFAACTCMLVFYLERVENVFPNINCSISVPES